MKYKFERDLEKNLLSMDVINARRFARAVDEVEADARPDYR